MQISVKKSFSINLLLCAGIVLGSISFKKAEALTIPYTGYEVTNERIAASIAITAAVGVITRLAIKDDPKKEGRIDLNNFFEELEKRDTIKAKLSFCVEFIDDVIIGYKGKINGPKAVESKILIEGDATEVVETEKNQYGQKVEWRRIPHLSPYGLIGNLWATAKIVSKEINGVKELAGALLLIGALYKAEHFPHFMDTVAAGKPTEPKKTTAAPTA